MSDAYEAQLTGQQIVDFLRSGLFPDHRESSVQIIHTHASTVGIGQSTVLKIKKNVNFGFLDFSSLEKRYYYCQKEIELNSRICPSIYIGVVPILWDQDTLVFGAINTKPDDAVEYAVYMHRLDEENFLQERLSRGDSGIEDIQKVSKKISSFYENLPVDSSLAKSGTVDSIRVSTSENFEQLRELSISTIPSLAVDLLEYYTQSFFDQAEPLFNRRIQEERIKDCHGDLHLEHVHISDEAVCIFDCIEFNERFRSIDIINDYAFLSMDLDFHGYDFLSSEFVDRMVEYTSDSDAYSLIDFYKVYRAIVRAKVNGFISSDSGIDAQDRQSSENLASEYIRLALRYSLGGSKPLIIGLTGQIGSGKSALARRVQEIAGIQWLSSDHIRKEIAGLPLHERPDPETRKWLYSSEMSQKTYDTLFETGSKMVELGQSVILDATFHKKENRDRLRGLADVAGCDYYIVETTASEETRKERLGRREHNTDETSDARLEDFEKLGSLFQSPDEVPDHRLITVETEGTHLETVFKALKGLIDRNISHVLQ